MSSEPQQEQHDDSVEVKGFGLEGKLRGRRLFSENVLLLLAMLLLATLGYKHHTTGEDNTQRLFEAIQENTYVLSLSIEEREKLNIRMPDSLRKKQR